MNPNFADGLLDGLADACFHEIWQRGVMVPLVIAAPGPASGGMIILSLKFGKHFSWWRFFACRERQSAFS